MLRISLAAALAAGTALPAAGSANAVPLCVAYILAAAPGGSGACQTGATARRYEVVATGKFGVRVWCGEVLEDEEVVTTFTAQGSFGTTGCPAARIEITSMGPMVTAVAVLH